MSGLELAIGVGLGVTACLGLGGCWLRSRYKSQGWGRGQTVYIDQTQNNKNQEESNDRYKLSPHEYDPFQRKTVVGSPINSPLIGNTIKGGGTGGKKQSPASPHRRKESSQVGRKESTQVGRKGSIGAGKRKESASKVRKRSHSRPNKEKQTRAVPATKDAKTSKTKHTKDKDKDKDALNAETKAFTDLPKDHVLFEVVKDGVEIEKKKQLLTNANDETNISPGKRRRGKGRSPSPGASPRRKRKGSPRGRGSPKRSRSPRAGRRKDEKKEKDKPIPDAYAVLALPDGKRKDKAADLIAGAIVTNINDAKANDEVHKPIAISPKPRTLDIRNDNVPDETNYMKSE